MIDMFNTIAADNFRLCKSKRGVVSVDDTYNLIKIPKRAYVTHVNLQILTPFDDQTVDGTLSVGFSGNKEASNATYFLTTTEAAALVAGNKLSTKPKYFDAGSGIITLTAIDNDSVVDAIVRLFVSYVIIN